MLLGGGGDIVGRGIEAEVGAMGPLSGMKCEFAFEPRLFDLGASLPGGVN